MATLNLRRFSRPENLRAIRGDNLVALLAPARSYFRSHDVELPKTTELSASDYARIAKVLMQVDSEAPGGLLDTIYYVSELSDAVGLDSILDGLKERGHTIRKYDQQSSADVAAQAWLLDPELVKEVHAERQVHRKKAFENFRPKPNGVVPWKPPKAAALQAMERAMDDWFDEKRRGRGCRVIILTDEKPFWFLVRHGKPIERAAAMEKGKSSGVVFRPEIHDVLIYDPESGELRVSTSTQGELDLYRKQFGRHLFGDDDYFATQLQFTLAPLRDLGVDALNCEDFDGIDSIVLRQIEIWQGGSQNEVETHRADDVFAAFAQRNTGLPTSGKLQCAKFDVKFSDAPKPRSVTIRLPRTTTYVRDYDSATLEGWLRKRQFYVGK
jgi:hypothetical protein